jgi:thiamine-phosphate pyrophosphorylase
MIGYYFITDASLSRRGNLSDVKQALKAKVRVIQYRDKFAPAQELYSQALKLKSLCKNSILLINDRIDIALSVNADGVHLGQDDLPYRVARKLLGKKRIIGVTVHNLRQAREAEGLGANYIAVSPIFPTRTKLDAGSAQGVRLIKEIRKRVAIPIIAIGGINLINAREVVKAGANGLCAISAVVTRPDVKREIEKFQRLFRA